MKASRGGVVVEPAGTVDGGAAGSRSGMSHTGDPSAAGRHCSTIESWHSSSISCLGSSASLARSGAVSLGKCSVLDLELSSNVKVNGRGAAC